MMHILKEEQTERVDDLIRVQSAEHFYEVLKNSTQESLFNKWKIASSKASDDSDIMIAIKWQLKMAIRKICIERDTWNYKLQIPTFSEGTLPFET